MLLWTGSKLRKKLLAYVFTHPDEPFYVRELGVFIDEDAGNLSRELRNLEEEGLFHSQVRGRIKLYTLNKKYPLYREIKEMVFKTAGVEGELKSLVEKYPEIVLAVIYGSYARGAEKAGSDVDLVLAGKDVPDDLVQRLRKLEAKIGREINFSFYSEKEFKSENKKKGSFLNVVLSGKIIVIKGALNG